MRRAALFLTFLMVGGCAFGPHLPKFDFKAPVAAPVVPVNVVCAASAAAVDPMPAIPAGATIPAAQTPEASSGFQTYLGWLHDLAAWGREGWRCVAADQAACAK